MNRRDFLHRSALIAAGVVAADQIDLLERLAPRRFFPSADPTALMLRQNFVGMFRMNGSSLCFRHGKDLPALQCGDELRLVVPGYASPYVAVGKVECVRAGQITVDWTQPYDATTVAALRTDHPMWSEYWS